MKKLFATLITTVFAIQSFAQCDPATIKDLPSVYTKKPVAGSKLASEQEKYLSFIYTSVVEPAIKGTKGLQGTWDSKYDFNTTPEGFTKSLLDSYMLTMGCKDNKSYAKDEQGLVLSFILNDVQSILRSQIADVCSHEEDKWLSAEDSRTIYVKDVLNGRQIYFLKAPTPTTEYSKFAFYRKTDRGEYFVISKPGVPLFLPLTIRQALEINKQNYTHMLAALRQSPFFEDAYSKQIKIVDHYLKNTPAKDLDKPCTTCNTGFLWAIFGDDTDEITSIKSNISNFEAGKAGTFVTLNSAYFNNTISKIAPQFISVELETQGNSVITLNAYNKFKANLDFNKLQSMLVK